MTRVHKPADPAPAIRPSAPDPVDAWLDVLVAMLSIPKADRQTVRDELEDHLRSRIDDLLIHGLTEPQALQKAVAELGETADLARQLSHAHKPHRTRRLAMHGLIIALAGTVVALGVNTMRPNAGLPAPGVAVSETVASAAPSVTVPEGKELSPELLATTAVVPVGRAVDLYEVLQPFAVRLSLPLEIDLAALGNRGLTALDKVMLTNNPERSLAAVLDAMTHSVPVNDWHKHGRPADRILAAKLGGRLVVTTQHGFDLRTATRRVYPLARFVENAPGPVPGGHAEVAYDRVMRAVMQHVSPQDWQDHGGDLATGTVLGSSMIVTAPARIHEQIGALLDDLHAQAVEQAGERRAIESDRRAIAAREHTELVARVKDEYERVLSEQIALSRKIEQLNTAVSEQHIKRGALPTENREAAIKAINQEFVRIGAEINTTTIRLGEATARVNYLRTRMIEIEYEPLVSARNTKATSNPSTHSQTVTVRGRGLREGVYNMMPGTTVRRMLTSAGALESESIRAVQLIRNDDVVHEWTLQEANSRPKGDTLLLPGDTLAVLH